MDSPRNRWLEPVPWAVFLFVAGLVSAMFGGIIIQHSSLSEALAKEKDSRITGDAQQLQLSNDLKAQYASIQAKLEDVSTRLLELKQDIKNTR